MDITLRSPANKLSRMQQYKASTPPWKETYRKRCVDRLKNSRQKFQDNWRKINSELSCGDSMIKDVMRDEWKSLQRENHDLPALSDDVEFNFEDDLDDIDTVLSIFEEIQRELRIEEYATMVTEQHLLEEYARYEASVKFDDSLLCSAVECLCTDDIICPICQKDVLVKNRNVILCKCGLRIDTEQDSIRLENVQAQMHSGLGEHNQQCDETPSFSVVKLGTVSNLLMTCTTCDFMFIVI